MGALSAETELHLHFVPGTIFTMALGSHITTGNNPPKTLSRLQTRYGT